jgi:hypothetical protein
MICYMIVIRQLKTIVAIAVTVAVINLFDD